MITTRGRLIGVMFVRLLGACSDDASEPRELTSSERVALCANEQKALDEALAAHRSCKQDADCMEYEAHGSASAQCGGIVYVRAGSESVLDPPRDVLRDCLVRVGLNGSCLGLPPPPACQAGVCVMGTYSP